MDSGSSDFLFVIIVTAAAVKSGSKVDERSGRSV